MDAFFLSVIVCAGLIVFSLAVYAGWLLIKLHHQTKLQKRAKQDALDLRNLKIIESVDVIAMAALQEQCDFSEAAIRLYMIMTHLQGNKSVDFPERFPALYELYDLVKDMPRSEKRKCIQKKERMRFDMLRLKAQARLQTAIEFELESILVFTGAKMEKIQALRS